MSVRSKLKKAFLPIIGLVFAFLTLFTPPLLQNVYAEPSTPTVSTEQTETTTETDTETSNSPTSETANSTSPEGTSSADEEESTSCFTQLGALGWIVCPGTGLVATLTDTLYNVIESLLVIQPLTTDNSSPLYIVWEYTRSITNIVFVILILIIVYSQITGLNLGNLSTKKLLPRIIIAAVLINLSYFICTLAIDASNILGASIRGAFTAAEEAALAGSTISADASTSIAAVVSAFAGAGVIGGVSIAAAGGGAAFFIALIPVLLGALIAVVIGFLTIALRQAVVFLLIMISPLAFVSYTLPNTEKWFHKWFEVFFQMLVFYPMFSALFGASHLAGLILVTNGINLAQSGSGPMGILWIILGIGVQTVPLFLSFKLMKMSGTILGKLSATLDGLNNKLTGSARGALDPYRQLAAQRNLNKGLEKDRFGLGIASMRAQMARRQAKIQDALKVEQNTSGKLIDSYIKNDKLGNRRVIGYREDGSKIYSTPTKANTSMKREMRLREADLSNQALNAEYENAFSEMSSYMRANKLKDRELKKLADRQYGNYLELRTHLEAKANNDKADNRAYAEAVQAAANAGERSAAYRQLVTRAAGADFHNGEKNAAKSALIKNRAVHSAVSDAYNILGSDHNATAEIYGKYLSQLKTQDVLHEYENMLANKDIDGIIAAQNTLAMRGDYDKIGQHLSKFMDAGNVELGTYFSNTLASNLLSMKNSDPLLGRLGKHINMETWAYTNDDPSRTKAEVTFEEFFTGIVKGGGVGGKDRVTKINVASGLQGTSYKNIDRTAFTDLIEREADYLRNADGTQTEAQINMQRAIENAIMPQIVSALPTFDSGSEQIINTVSYLTGLSNNGSGWVNSRKDKPSDPRHNIPDAEFVHRTTAYLSALSPNDMVNMKSDTFGAIKKLFSDFYGGEANAKQKFMEIFSADSADSAKVIDIPGYEGQPVKQNTVLRRLHESRRSGSLNVAKSSVFSWLDLDKPAQ